MKKIKMLKGARGCDSKNDVPMPAKYYEEGEEYEVGDSLAKAFINDMKVAEECKPEKKAKEGAPENKSKKPVKSKSKSKKK